MHDHIGKTHLGDNVSQCPCTMSKIARTVNTSPPGNSNNQQYQNSDQMFNSDLKEY